MPRRQADLIHPALSVILVLCVLSPTSTSTSTTTTIPGGGE